MSLVIIVWRASLGLTRRVLPLMCLAYITQALDKQTLAPASIMGWIPDVGAQGQDYAMTSTLLWVGIISGEPIVSWSLPCFTSLTFSVVVRGGHRSETGRNAPAASLLRPRPHIVDMMMS